MRFMEPDYGDRRTITKFAIFPIKIGREIRWLERVTLEQRYGVCSWCNINFIDKKDNNTMEI